MKATVIGVTRIEGISNKSGKPKPYDIPRALILQPVEVATKQNDEEGTRYSKSGHGFEVAEIDLDANAMPLFAGLKFPATVELEIGQRMQFGRLASVCTGFKS